jgi:hypothetical protein
MTVPYTRTDPWQVKIGGFWWRFSFAEWSEWHQPQSEPHLRRAWWWLVHWPSYGKYCFRVCGLTLHGRREQWKAWVL